MNKGKNIIPKKYWDKVRKFASQESKKLDDEIERKAKEKIPEAKEKLLFLKWESLRRNQNYLDFYFKAYLLYLKLVDRNQSAYNIVSQKVEQKYLKKFGLTVSLRDVPHPHTPFDKLKHKEIFDLRAVQCWEPKYKLGPALKSDFSNTEEFLKEARNPQRIPADELAKKINIRVEINLLYSKTKILKELDDLLDNWIERKKKFDLHTKKTDMTDLKNYFKVYDLHTKNPRMTYREIAAQIFKKHDPSRNDERKAHFYCNKAKELIGQSI